MNKLVARLADGRILKGATLDFSPSKELFHMTLAGSMSDDTPLPVRTTDLKALFFVKDLDGDPSHIDKNDLDFSAPPGARRILAAFADGEVLVGSTTGYSAELPGFFLVPADTGSNNERCYVVTSATREISFL
jgi:hypothetical protein